MKPGMIGERPYEDAAAQATVTGWICKHCRRWYGDEKWLAQFCCATDRPCQECDGRAESSYIVCGACRARKDHERFLARERRAWDGRQMIYSEATDEYYADAGEALDSIGDEQGRTFEDMRFLLCDPNRGSYFEMAEFLSDDLPSDDPMSIDDAEINAVVNQWIADHAPFSWSPGKFAWNGEVEDASRPREGA